MSEESELMERDDCQRGEKCLRDCFNLNSHNAAVTENPLPPILVISIFNSASVGTVCYVRSQSHDSTGIIQPV